MKIDIEKANDAKAGLLARYPTIIGSATIVLGDDGFRIEIVWDHDYKWLPPKEFMGVPIVDVT